MQRGWPVAAVLAAVGLGLAGCGRDPDRIERYVVGQLKPALDAEAEALAGLQGLGDGGQVEPEVLAEALRQRVLPGYVRFLERFGQIRVEQAEAARLHEEYLTLARAQWEALELLLAAAQAQDGQKLQEADRRLSELGQKRQQWKESLRALCRRHGLALGGD